MTFIFSKVLPDPRLLAGHSRQSQPLPGVCGEPVLSQRSVLSRLTR